MNVLVVVAHPDDEVLGAGATIARHALQGDKVTIAILGEGVTSRSLSSEQTMNDLTQLRSYAQHAAHLLKAEELRTFSLPDNRFDSLSLLEIVKIIEILVQETNPEIVYTHFGGDLNVDHVLTSKATVTACRPGMGKSVKRLLAFEIPSSTEWATGQTHFAPNVFVDVHQTLPLKLEAMKLYRSEIREFPHPRSLQSLNARASYWGTVAGFIAAEPFILLREIMR